MLVDRREIEQTIREACQRQDWQAAATHTLRGYGPEVLGFLVGLENSKQPGRETFSTCCDKGLGSSLRVRWTLGAQSAVVSAGF
jgi:hypothetical protein